MKKVSESLSAISDFQLSKLMVKVSLRFRTICANGDKNGANGNPLAPMAMDLIVPMVPPIAIGANNNHRVAMCLPQSPMKANGINDVIDVNGSIGNIGYPLVQMINLWCH